MTIFDEIIDASYGIMIARGDLGIEVPIEQIPGIQRSIINKCIKKRSCYRGNTDVAYDD